jgi:hypothetical protein
MAKKRQLAGKTTKLAKLPLTQALTELAEEGEGHPRPAPQVLGSSEPLGAVYLHVIRELTSLLSQLQADPLMPTRPFGGLLPPHIPKPEQLRLALHQAQQGLLDLKLILSRS